MDEDFDYLVTTYNIVKDYVPAGQMQGAADHLMGVIVDTMEEEELRDFVLSASCKYLSKAYAEYDIEDEVSDDEDEIGSDYDNY
jgi:hypothetical protein|tara:strand:- start:170 stop:421 length:252 start_codon:yes stop_codon:yes gene_type:complete